MCRNLRVLDMSRCYGVSRADFCDAMLESSGAAANSKGSPERRLRLRKLRVLVTPYQSAQLTRPLGQMNVCEQSV
jgi:hypothetical protein